MPWRTSPYLNSTPPLQTVCSTDVPRSSLMERRWKLGSDSNLIRSPEQ